MMDWACWKEVRVETDKNVRASNFNLTSTSGRTYSTVLSFPCFLTDHAPLAARVRRPLGHNISSRETRIGKPQWLFGRFCEGSQVYLVAQNALGCPRPPSCCLLRACVSLSSRLSKLPSAKSFLLLFAVPHFWKDPHVSASSWQLGYAEQSHLLSCANEETDSYAMVTRSLLHRRKGTGGGGF